MSRKNQHSPVTETIDADLGDLELRGTAEILQLLQASQQRAIVAVAEAAEALEQGATQASCRLGAGNGRLILLGAGASGRLAVQDGAELWPTYGWPAERLLLCMAGGDAALLRSIEGSEDDVEDARSQVERHRVEAADVVTGVAASGSSAWTCEWIALARAAGALTIGLANNPGSRLLQLAECPILLDSGPEVLAGSTRMAAGTAQKAALNLLSTTIMIRLNRTCGNLMVDMAAVNRKLDGRRLRLLQAVLPTIDDDNARRALDQAGGWVKLAALLAIGCTEAQARQLLDVHRGSLRAALATARSS